MKLDKEIENKLALILSVLVEAKQDLEQHYDSHRKDDYDSEEEQQEVEDRFKEGFEDIEKSKDIVREWAAKIQDADKTYGGWMGDDLTSIAVNLGYEIPDEVADALMQKIVSKDCEVTWATIETVIECDLYEFGLKEYFVGLEGDDE